MRRKKSNPLRIRKAMFKRMLALRELKNKKEVKRNDNGSEN